MKRDKEILKGKIILYELYNNKLEKGYFSSLKQVAMCSCSSEI